MQIPHRTMMMAAKRWIMPAFSRPPMRPIHDSAQALSLYFSGMPVSTSVEKLIMMKKCTQRWNGVKRRKWVRAPATTTAGLVFCWSVAPSSRTGVSTVATAVHPLLQASVEVQDAVQAAQGEQHADEHGVVHLHQPHPE